MFTAEGVKADIGECVWSGLEDTSSPTKSDTKHKMYLHEACLSAFDSSVAVFNLCILPDTQFNRVLIHLKSSLFLTPLKLSINCAIPVIVSLISFIDSSYEKLSTTSKNLRSDDSCDNEPLKIFLYSSCVGGGSVSLIFISYDSSADLRIDIFRFGIVN